MNKRIGIYVHIPFCASKCAYCDFYSLADCDDKMQKYQSALLRHIKETSSQLEGYVADTVYFGGGTPSYYGAGRIISVLSALKKHGNILIDGEITVEANPDSLSFMDMLRLRRAGINRLSLGVQSANDGILKSIGRRYDFAKVEKTISDARRAGFDNISFDLIYGLPSQTREDWAETISRCAALKPDHFSCYGLKIEEGTPLYIYRNSPFIPDDDTQADMYLYAVEALGRFGYRQYEISNFAQLGFQSRHNLKYWQGGEYMSFGAAAHSYVGGRRYSYVSDVDIYCDRIVTGGSLIDHSEGITKYEQAGEYLMLGLRTVHGISESEYCSIFNANFDRIRSLLDDYVRHGWAVKNNDRWSLTPHGFLISNTLISSVLDAQTKQRSELVTPWRQEGDTEDGQVSFFETPGDDLRLFNGI